MAEIKGGDIARFLKTIPKLYFAVLICGSDTGLVAERTNLIVKALADGDNDPFRLVRLDGDAISQDSNLLADEALTISMFGGDRIVWISAGAKNFIPSLESLLALQPPGCRLVIEAGPLKNDSALKRLCLKSPNVAVLDCWPDGAREIANLIDDEMASSGLSLTAEARDLLVSMLGGDRLLSRGEIAKVKVYAHGQTSVTENDILAVVADASGSSFDNAIMAAFDGDRGGVLDIVKRVLLDFDAGALLSMALGHALILHQIRFEIEDGRSIEESVDRGSRFFGNKKTSIQQQLRIWTAFGLLQQIVKLSDSVLLLRREPKLSEELVTRMLLGVAYAAQRRQS